MANNWVDLGYDVEIVNFYEEQIHYNIDSRIELVTFNFKRNRFVLKRIFQIFKLIFELRHHIRKSNSVSILSFMNKYNVATLIAGFGLKTPIYVSERDGYSEKFNPYFEMTRDFFYQFSNGIICQTLDSANFIKSRVKHKNIIIIPNPLSKPILKNIDKENIILNVARLVPKKGHKYLIDAFNISKLKNWKLVIVGDGELRDELSDYILKTGNSNIFLEGKSKNVSDYYNKSKIFVLSSILEGFPNALSEAMSYGLSCISFDCDSGPSDIIEHKTNGYLIEQENIISPSEQLIDLTNNFNSNKNKSIRNNSKNIYSKLNDKSISLKFLNFITK